MPIVVRCTAKHTTYTRLYTSDVYIPDSGCSLGGRLKDSQKVRVSALAADAAALRKPLCCFGEKGIYVYFLLPSNGGSTQRKTCEFSTKSVTGATITHTLAKGDVIYTCSTLRRASKSASVGSVCQMSEDVSYLARRRGNLKKT